MVDSQPVIYKVNISIDKNAVSQLLIFSLTFVVWISLLMKIYQQTSSRHRGVKKAFQFFFLVINIGWIISCLILLLQSVLKVLYQQEGRHGIVSLFPWYIVAILSCCFIDVIEGLIFSNGRRYKTFFIKALPTSQNAEKLDEKKNLVFTV